MHISAINNYNQQPQFKAKFLDTPAIREVAKWAVKTGNFKKLNDARKQIDYAAVKARIHMDLATNVEGYPIAIFKRYFPKKLNPVYEEDYVISRPIVYTGKDRDVSAIEYGYKKIIQMGFYVTRNRLFKDVIIESSNL